MEATIRKPQTVAIKNGDLTVVYRTRGASLVRVLWSKKKLGTTLPFALLLQQQGDQQ